MQRRNNKMTKLPTDKKSCEIFHRLPASQDTKPRKVLHKEKVLEMIENCNGKIIGKHIYISVEELTKKIKGEKV
jgi:hypothetical protein